MYPGQEQQQQPAMGGYQPPTPGYGAGGVQGMTQQFGQMDMSQKPPVAAAPQQSQRAPVLNQLYPTDLSNQPLNVAELDYPPPPAILPPNVSIQLHSCLASADSRDRPVSLLLPTPTAHPNMFDRP